MTHVLDQINMLFMSVDVDGSGSIDMEEFYPVFHEVCVCVCVCVCDCARTCVRARECDLLKMTY